MKHIIVIVLLVLLVSCTPFQGAPTPAKSLPTQTPLAPVIVEGLTAPHAVMRTMYSALNAGDINAAMKYFADDAVFIVHRFPNKGIRFGRDEIRAWLDQEIASGTISVISDYQMQGNTVTLLYRRIQNAEIATQEFQTSVVIHGKITAVGADVESVVRYAFSSISNGKTEQAMAFFADDAVCELSANNPLRRREKIRDAIQEYVDTKIIFEVRDITVQNSQSATWILGTYQDGKLINETRETGTIEDGKIKTCQIQILK